MADAKKSSGQSRVFRWVFLPFRLFVRGLGWIAFLLLVLAFTRAPWSVYEWLGDDGVRLSGDPDYIVVMGGGGIPSESGLMRTYAGAAAADRFPKARVVVAMPGSLSDTNSAVARMKAELILRGVAKTRIMAEHQGRHTRGQALNCFQLFAASNRQPGVLVVSSPEHVRRCLLSFRKAGFTNVAGQAAMAESVEVDLRFETVELKGRRVPDVGSNLLLRYRFWTNLELEAKCLHEFVALLYYKVMGWI